MYKVSKFSDWWHSLTWDNHTEQLISRLNAIKTVQAMLLGKVLQMLYFSYVHSIISYGIIFWGNTTNSIKIFTKGKKKLIIITNSKKSYLSILSIYFHFYLCGEQHTYLKKILEVHNHETRSANNFHVPITNVAKY